MHQAIGEMYATPRSAMIGLFLLSVSCADQSSSEIARTSSGIVSQSEAELRELPIPVCFFDEYCDATCDPYDGTQAQREWVREKVEEHWQGLPRSAVAFTGWDSCPNPAGPEPVEPAEFIKIKLDSSYVTGHFYDSLNEMRLTTSQSESYNLHAVIHEFGHVLGLRHEQLHPGSTCAERDGPEALDGSDLILSTYDDEAVMDYCAGEPTALTDREVMFAEMAYPSTVSNHPLRATHSYQLSGVLLVRSESTLQTDWTARGALPAAFTSVGWLSGTVSSVELPVSSLNPLVGGVVIVDHEFVDFRGVSRTGAETTVAVRDDIHAAITSVLVL